jgi:hypothetical protein
MARRRPFPTDIEDILTGRPRVRWPDDNVRIGAIAWGMVVALLIGFFVAVAAVKGSGDCWSNCDSDVDTVYNVAPLGIWAAGVGLSWAALCLYLWAQLYRSQAGWGEQVKAALVALVATAPLVAVVAGLLQASG